MFSKDLAAKKEAMIEAYTAYKNAERAFVASIQPSYMTVPRWCEENNVHLSYDMMQEMGERARRISLRLAKSIRILQTPIGNLFMFDEDSLLSAYAEIVEDKE